MIPVGQICPKCGDYFMGSDVVGYPCSNCSLTGAPPIDYSFLEDRILETADMSKTAADIYGNVTNARKSLVATLNEERRFWQLELDKKQEFITWALKNADKYDDGDRVDWIGAFYDWIDGS
jgi:hypothetical protein